MSSHTILARADTFSATKRWPLLAAVAMGALFFCISDEWIQKHKLYKVLPHILLKTKALFSRFLHRSLVARSLKKPTQFSDLPPELRQPIYDTLLRSYRHSNLACRARLTYGMPQALLRVAGVNQEMRYELCTSFWHCNTYLWDTSYRQALCSKSEWFSRNHTQVPFMRSFLLLGPEHILPEVDEDGNEKIKVPNLIINLDMHEQVLEELRSLYRARDIEIAMVSEGNVVVWFTIPRLSIFMLTVGMKTILDSTLHDVLEKVQYDGDQRYLTARDFWGIALDVQLGMEEDLEHYVRG